MTLSKLRQQCLTCTACALCKTRTNVVFGSGNEAAKVMLIGEAPGQNEDETGLPFIGRGGKLLDELLCTVGLNRDRIYIANTVKCRPPQNRDPKSEEQEACISYLNKQFKLISPKLVVCLGRISAMRLIDKNFKVTKDHGKLFAKNEFQIMGTFHPAAILRNPNNKQLAIEDFKLIAKIASSI